MFSADEKTRDFQYDGRRVPSVSDVLDLYFPFPVQFLPAGAAAKGTARHEWYSAIIRGLEIEGEPDPRIAGEIAAFRKFCSECKPIYKFGEVRYYDPLLGICGKPDFVGEIGGSLCVCDWKPQTKYKRTQAQVAGYFVLLRNNKVPVLDRYSLRLYDDGKYRMDPFKDDGDLIRWVALVNGYKASRFYL